MIHVTRAFPKRLGLILVIVSMMATLAGPAQAASSTDGADAVVAEMMALQRRLAETLAARRGDDPIDLARMVLSSRLPQSAPANLLALQQAQIENLDRAEALLRIARTTSGDKFADAVALVREANAAQARSLGAEVASVDPDAAAGMSTSESVLALLERYGESPSQAQVAAIATLDTLPTSTKGALASVVSSFLEFESATQDAFAHLGRSELEGLADKQRLIEDYLARIDTGSSPQDVPDELLAVPDLDLSGIVVARGQLIDAVATLTTVLRQPGATSMRSSNGGNADATAAVGSAAASATGASAAGAAACTPPLCIQVRDVLSIDLRTTVVHGADADNEYARGTNYALAIDAGGNDTYFNNAGGSMLRPCGLFPGAGALLDAGGDDAYGSLTHQGSCGANGAGFIGAGFLFDAFGDDRYTRSGSAINGGANLGGVGFLFDASGQDEYLGDGASNGAGLLGSGFLLDAGVEDDSYAGGTVSNGAGAVGNGFLLDGGGNESYKGGAGTNGGGLIAGSGFLLDATGADSYRGGDGGVNGGGAFASKGFLFDGGTLNSNDSYTAGSTGTNGGSWEGGGLLFDSGGNDNYHGGSKGTNGGGWIAAAGLLFDVSGDDYYGAEDTATNGGGTGGGGALVDLTGNDAYSSGSHGTNGGASPELGLVSGSGVPGSGLLFDGTGDDSYIARGHGTNGGSESGVALLHDVAGDDEYLASGPATNGAGEPNDASDPSPGARGGLFDGSGLDRYEESSGALTDCTVDPKGSGRQVDAPNSSGAVCAPLPSAPGLRVTPGYPADHEEATVHVATLPGAKVTLYDDTDSPCRRAPVATATADANGAASFRIVVADDSVTQFRARTTDTRGASVCSRAAEYIEDSTAPVLSIDPMPSPEEYGWPTVSGVAGTLPGDGSVLVNIYRGDSTAGTPATTLGWADTDSFGRWEKGVFYDDRLSSGRYTAEAIQQDHAGHTDRVTEAMSVAAPSSVGEVEGAPVVTGIQPAHGLAGQKVTLTGHELTDVGIVYFGNQPAEKIANESTESRLVVKVPASYRPGPVYVMASKSGGYAAGTPRFTYCPEGFPTCGPEAALADPTGPMSGGTEVVIRGDGFEGAAGVMFGSVAAPYFRVVSETKIVAVTPPQPAGTVSDVKVVSASGETLPAGDPSRFAYVDVPQAPAVVASVTGATESFTQGGATVTITGENLYPGRVSFGASYAEQADMSWHSERRIVVRAPAHAPGSVPVKVETPVNTTVVIDDFTYARTWSPAGSSTQSRVWHTATLLDGPACGDTPRPAYCGTVLLTGGARAVGERTSDDAVEPVAAAELYDPAVGTFLEIPPMAGGRFDHTATPLDGPRCRTDQAPEYCDKVLVVGGVGPSAGRPARPAVELYDPSADEPERVWRSQEAGDCTVPGETCPASIPYQEVEVPGLGGEVENRVASSAPLVERFDHTATLLDGPRCAGGGAPLWCGKVLIVGGSRSWCCRAPLSSVLLYDPADGTWTVGPLLNACAQISESCTARTSHTATLLEDGRVLVAGGLGPGNPSALGQRDVLSTAQVYDPNGGNGVGTWSPTDSLGQRKLAATVTLLDGPACSVSDRPAYCGAVLVTGGFREVGVGGNEEALSHSELYFPNETAADGSRGAFAPVPSLRKARGGHSATLLPDGKVLVVGSGPRIMGEAETERQMSAEVYDPSTGEKGDWSYTNFLNTARGGHAATLIQSLRCSLDDPEYCGRVLVTGGSPALGPYVPATGAAEMYIPPPEIASVTPNRSDALSPDRKVTITGTGFAGATGVAFGSFAAPEFTIVSPTEITAVAPAEGAGTVEVVVTNAGGPSDEVANPKARFSFVGTPERVTDLAATADSERSVELSFSAVGFAGADSDVVVSDYVIKQSRSPITSVTEFAGAAPLCGGTCHFEAADPAKPLKVGSPLTQKVQGLSPGTNYYYAVQAKSGDRYGELSDAVEVRTLGEPVEETTGVLGQVDDLSASSKSVREIELSFSAADNGNAGGADRYVIKQATEPITEESFDSAKLLCGGVCSFDVVDAGDKVSLAVKDLKASTTYHYAVKALGEGDQQGPMSNVASAITDPDTIAPDAVTDLDAAPLSGSEIQVSFSAPASDAGEGPPVTDYVIKQAREPITDATFEDARTLCEGTCEFTPAEAGEQLSLSVTGLESSSTYHYALKAIDEGDNVSGLSNSAFATTSQVTPGKVTDLKANRKSMSKISLAFAAADDGTGEAATSYVIKQSKRAIRSEDDFSKAQTLCGGSCRFEATEIGQSLRLAVTGLDPGTTYHYAVRTLDDSGDNLGARSASVKATTRPDRIDPGKVDDLKAKALSKTAVKLAFSAVASNGNKGPAVASYIIKQSTRPITSARDFKKAQTLCGKICTFDADNAGAAISLKITDLRPGTTYYYSVVAKDAGGNRGPRSKSAKTQTRSR